jgi:ABC-2 type transport system permease protein
MNMHGINPATTRKLKYGAIAIILTAVVVAAVIIFNAIFSSLVYKYNWYIDMTKEGLYGLTDAGRALLDDIDAEINIIFCQPYDELEKSSYMKMIYSLVKEMAASYDNINYSYIDIISNPTAVTKYKTTTASSIKTTDVIVESGTEFRVFKAQALFVQNESGKVWAFNGELKLISAMIQITQAETPIAYFTSTHGETISTDMAMLFYDAGFEIRAIDLTKEDFDPAGRLLVISNPIYDFEGISPDTKGRKSEIEKIDDFLDGFGNLMVFIDPDTRDLPELFEFLTEWGIEFDKSILKDPSNSLDTDHYSIVGQYTVNLSTDSQTYNPDALGASLVSSITSLPTPPKTVVHYARPINRLWDSKEGRITSTVLYTSKNAEKYVDGKKVEEGQYPLIVLSRYSRYIDNTPHYSYVFACGSQYLTASDYLGRKAYGNSDIVYAMMRTMGKTQVPVDLDFKVFDDESLDITTAEATNWTIFLTAAIPGCFLIAGIIVFIRRKHA